MCSTFIVHVVTLYNYGLNLGHYQCCKLRLEPAHSEESVYSFHHHQSRHCSFCSWHNAASGSFLQAKHVPVQKGIKETLNLYCIYHHYIQYVT